MYFGRFFSCSFSVAEVLVSGESYIGRSGDYSFEEEDYSSFSSLLANSMNGFKAELEKTRFLEKVLSF